MDWINRFTWLVSGFMALACVGLLLLHVLVVARLAGW
jgi:hypothetical protein